MASGFEGSDTRARLLEAGSEVFADVGYRSATLREICRRAEANNAAINYHFRDKEQLYCAVIEELLEKAQGVLPYLAVDADAPPEEKLYAFVRASLHSLLGSGRMARLLKLMSHEMSEPTPALDLIVEKVVRPVSEALGGIVRELLGPEADQRTVTDCARSIMSQCVTYDHSQAIIVRLGHYTEFDDATIEHLAHHIVSFSLGGIRALAGRLNRAVNS